MHERILVDKRTAGQALGVSSRTIDNLVSRGELRPRKIGRRVLFEWRALQLFAKSDHATQPSRKGGNT